MKYVKQFFIILVISLLGEMVHYVVPLPIPASIYGMILMLITLLSGIVKLEQVKDISRFLSETMPMMFVPAAVGLMVSISTLKEIWMGSVVIIIGCTVIVIAVTGKVTQAIIRKEEKHGKYV